MCTSMYELWDLCDPAHPLGPRQFESNYDTKRFFLYTKTFHIHFKSLFTDSCADIHLVSSITFPAHALSATCFTL